MKKRFLVVLGLSLLLTATSFAQASSVKPQNKIVIKYMEDRIYGNLVEINVTKDTADNSYIDLKDHSGELLYTDSLKGLKYTKKFHFDIPDEEIKKGIVLTIYNNKRKYSESFVITQ